MLTAGIGVGWRPRMYEVDMDPVEPLFLAPRRRSICRDAQRGFAEAGVWRRTELPVRFSFTGPAIVEQADTTTLVYRGHRATVDSLGNILIDVPLPE